MSEEKQLGLDEVHPAAGGEAPKEPAQGEVVSPAEQADGQKPGLTIRDTQATSILDPNMYIQMKALANDFIASKAIPKHWETPAQVLIGLQAGIEMGMKPMEAINSLYPVNGAINIWGKAVTRRLREHGYMIKFTDESQEAVTATVWKKGEKYTETYTFAEADESGYTKDNYGKLKIGWKPGITRKKKLRYGALNMIINTYIADVLGSAMGIQELAEDVDFTKPQLTSGDRRTRMIEAQNRSQEKLNGSNHSAKAVKTEGDKEE